VSIDENRVSFSSGASLPEGIVAYLRAELSVAMRAVLILNPTSEISTVTEKRMSVEDTKKPILEGLLAYGIEPEVYHTTPEDTGQGLAPIF